MDARYCVFARNVMQTPFLFHRRELFSTNLRSLKSNERRLGRKMVSVLNEVFRPRGLY